MSEVLARIRVKEEHGIRRFLYPLKTSLPLVYGPERVMIVLDEDGNALPSQSFWFGPFGRPGLDFALSLDPHQSRELAVVNAREPSRVPDPLRNAVTPEGYTVQQDRFRSLISRDGQLASIEYDDIQHLAGPLEITYSGGVSGAGQHPLESWTGDLTVHLAWAGEFTTAGKPIGYRTDYLLTACKSWVTVYHTLEHAEANSDVNFSLPLNALDDIPTADFGIGNGVYSKIGEDSVKWITEFGSKPFAQWRVATHSKGAEREDYTGVEQTRTGFAPRAWLHWIERNKALAVAITDYPRSCKRIEVSVNKNGNINIEFTLGQKVPRVIKFGICYHFLNDIPAIAAATNPQSILLPPTVEVLPISP